MTFWTKETQSAIEDYHYSTDDTKKNRIYNTKLYRPLYEITRQALFTFTSATFEDDIQDLMLFLYIKVLPKIREDKIDGVFQLIWISLRNKIYSDFSAKKNRNIYTTTATGTLKDFEYYTNENEIDLKYNTIDIQKEIINKLNTKITNEENIIQKNLINNVNKTNIKFLTLLKDYIIDNEYDVTEFRNYCLKEMDITKEKFWNIANHLNIKTKIMFEKKK